MLDVMFDCPSRDDISEVTINRSVVEGKKSPLLRKKQEKPTTSGKQEKDAA